jgi:hypothetical protein
MTKETLTLEAELLQLLQEASQNGVKLESVAFTCGLRTRSSDFSAKLQIANPTELSSSSVIRAMLRELVAAALHQAGPRFTDYYGQEVRVIGVGEEYLIQHKVGCVWQKVKAIPQANKFAATDARAAAQALARAKLGGH